MQAPSSRLAMGVALLALAAGSSHAEIYKWVDEDGQVHYSERRPPAAARSEQTVNVYDGKTSKAEQERLQRDIERSNEYFEERQKARKTAAEGQAKASTRRQNCDAARNRLQNLQQAQRVFRTDEQGNRVRLGEDQRQQAMEEARKQISEWCG